MHFQLLWKVEKWFEGLKFLLVADYALHNLLLIVLKFMNLRDVLIFQELIKFLFLLI